MLQTIQGRLVYVVEFDTVPETPITGLIDEEVRHNQFLKKLMGPFASFKTLTGSSMLYEGNSVYAQALTAAIDGGVITEGGKYAIYVDRKTGAWEVARVIE